MVYGHSEQVFEIKSQFFTIGDSKFTWAESDLVVIEA